MNIKTNTTFAVILLVSFTNGAAHAALTATNRLAVSARAAFNIKAAFGYSASVPVGPGRTTPDGLPFNYDDGYVYPDSDGGADT